MDVRDSKLSELIKKPITIDPNATLMKAREVLLKNMKEVKKLTSVTEKIKKELRQKLVIWPCPYLCVCDCSYYYMQVR